MAVETRTFSWVRLEHARFALSLATKEPATCPPTYGKRKPCKKTWVGFGYLLFASESHESLNTDLARRLSKMVAFEDVETWASPSRGVSTWRRGSIRRTSCFCSIVRLDRACNETAFFIAFSKVFKAVSKESQHEIHTAPQ